MKDIVTKVKYLDGRLSEQTITGEEAGFDYRSSIFSEKNSIILEAELELNRGAKENIEHNTRQYLLKRVTSQPLEYPSAGSTFKRGNDFITARLIDNAGLKGYSIGDAEVSTKHAGFIINKGNATAKDVLSLIKYVQDKVFKKFRKKIELEIKIIGKS